MVQTIGVWNVEVCIQVIRKLALGIVCQFEFNIAMQPYMCSVAGAHSQEKYIHATRNAHIS